MKLNLKYANYDDAAKRFLEVEISREDTLGHLKNRAVELWFEHLATPKDKETSIDPKTIRLVVQPLNDLLRMADSTELGESSLFDESIRKPKNPDTGAIWIHVQLLQPRGGAAFRQHGNREEDDGGCCTIA